MNKLNNNNNLLKYSNKKSVEYTYIIYKDNLLKTPIRCNIIF